MERIARQTGFGTLLVALSLGAALALGGCSAQAGTATNDAAQSSAQVSASAAAHLSESIDGEQARAMVSAVNGSTITVNVMAGMPGQAPGAGQNAGDPNAASSVDNGQGASQATEPNAAENESQEQAEATASEASSNGTGVTAPEPPTGDANGGTPPEPPAAQGNDGGTPPEMPAGSEGGAAPTTPADANGGTPPEPPAGDANGGTPPEPPAGDANGGTPPEMPGDMGGTEMTLTIDDESIIFVSENGTETQGSLADISEGTMLELAVQDGATVGKILVNKGGMGGPQGGQGGPGQGSGTVNNGTGATTFTENASEADASYGSTESDQNAVRAESGATVSLTNATVTKSGDSSSSEDSDFYGLNAGVLAYDGAKLAIEGGTVNTDAKGANGVFAYGEGTEVEISTTTIHATQGNSGGIEVAGGASLVAKDLDVDTQGESSAAIRSDRGGGTEVVTGGSYATHGKHSPAVYSTADVTVNGATLSAENTEGVVIEGKNSVALNDCEVTGNINGNATRTGIVNNVMIYQSMSGDASEGTGSFSMSGGSFTAAHGTLFYVTNTDATIELEAVDIQNADGQLLVAAGNDGQWGRDGSNGGTVSLTAKDQVLAGSITVDELSSLDLSLTDESAYTGAINAEGQAGAVEVALEAGSTWKLDGDSYITSLTGDTSGIDLNGHTLYVNGKAWSA